MRTKVGYLLQVFGTIKHLTDNARQQDAVVEINLLSSLFCIYHQFLPGVLDVIGGLFQLAAFYWHLIELLYKLLHVSCGRTLCRRSRISLTNVGCQQTQTFLSSQ